MSGNATGSTAGNAIAGVNVTEAAATLRTTERCTRLATKSLSIARRQDGELKVHANTVRIADYAMRYCRSLTEVTFEGTALKEIGNAAFEWCDSLTSIAIPDSVTTLGTDVFSTCNDLTHIKLPANLESFSASMLGCENLQEIDIEGGVNFATDDEGGAIYTADMKQLLYYLPTRTTADYTVPEGVTEISENAFSATLTLKA